jgi:hypothetical protein
MTVEQVQEYAATLGITPDQVWALFTYWQHGGP